MPWMPPPLPRELEADATAAALRVRLALDVRPLWRAAATSVPVLPLDAPLVAALGRAARAGALVLGLEAAAAALDREERGLAAVAARGAGTRTARVSRLLLVADDGAERFYRGVERLLVRHAGRLLGCRLQAPARQLGRAVSGGEAAVKAVLVRHREAVAEVLRAVTGAPAAA